VRTGRNPDRPHEAKGTLLDEVWSLLEAGWSEERTRRPSSSEVLQNLSIVQRFRQLGGTIDLPLFRTLTEASRLLGSFANHLENITSIHLDTTSRENGDRIRIVDDVRRYIPLDRWTNLILRTQSLSDLEAALRPCIGLSKPDRAARSVRTLSL